MKHAHIPTLVRAITQLSGCLIGRNDGGSEDGLLESVLDEVLTLVAPDYEPKLDNLGSLRRVEVVARRACEQGVGGTVEAGDDSVVVSFTNDDGTLTVTVTAETVTVRWSCHRWGAVNRALLVLAAEHEGDLTVAE